MITESLQQGPFTVAVAIPGRDAQVYEILVGEGILDLAAEELAARRYGHRAVIICDAITHKLFYQRLANALQRHGLDSVAVSIPPGEPSKCLHTLEQALERMLAAGCNRADMAIALGGGVVGDLTALAAGLFMRGIPCVQMPTTLLAQVDSSVGGKAAVNLPGGKNCCGLFLQPVRVYADTALLASLPDTELDNGLAEAAKHALIADHELAASLAAQAPALKQRDPQALATVVRRCVEIKAAVVAQDDKERGLRRILNYGHTLGHALELAHDLPHGLAVAYGMRAAAYIAETAGMLPRSARHKHDALLDALGLACDPLETDFDRVLQLVARDKKADATGVKFVLLEDIGSPCIVQAPPPEVLRNALAQLAALPGRQPYSQDSSGLLPKG